MQTVTFDDTVTAHLKSTLAPVTSDYSQHRYNRHSLTAIADRARNHHILCDTNTNIGKFTHNSLVLSHDQFTAALLHTCSLTTGSSTDLSGDEMTTGETLPGSPPDLSSSKSSTKSSSFQSSLNDDFNDISNLKIYR